MNREKLKDALATLVGGVGLLLLIASAFLAMVATI